MLYLVPLHYGEGRVPRDSKVEIENGRHVDWWVSRRDPDKHV
jgi:hypothetical protein